MITKKPQMMQSLSDFATSVGVKTRFAQKHEVQLSFES